jgi:signal peptidase II
LVLIDQLAKTWVRGAFPIRRGGIVSSRRIEVIPSFFDLVHIENRGAAWGLLRTSEYRQIFFVVVTLVAFVMIANYYRKLGPRETVLAVGLCCIFAGAAGNFIDRLLFQQVTDFLDFYVGSRHWPAFNVADICICVGVGLFAVHSLFLDEQPSEQANEAPP